MSSRNHVPHITPEEWRWVIFLSGILVTITLLPYAGALATNNTALDVQFMGLMANPQDGATYLAKMEQGYRGDALFHLAFTPEAHNGSAVFLFYIFMGHMARFFGLAPVIVFHIMRVLGGLFMYMAFYQFAASVWTRTRPRRLFFLIAGVGSGFGWLAATLGLPTDLNNLLIPDLAMPEAFPLYAVFATPHFPITFGALALIGSIYIQVFRPGVNVDPKLYNQGAIIALASITLGIIMPQALVPIGVTLGLYIVIRFTQTRAIPAYEFSWAALLWLPAAIFALYYFAATQANPALYIWNAQNITLSPPPHYYLISFGPVLIAAMPGLWRAVRRFERDGDQLMLTWLAANALLLYVPMNAQRRFVVGLMIPLVYFAVRAIEDYWSKRISERFARPALIAFIIILLPSQFLALGIPIFGTLNTEAGLEGRLLLETDYVDAIGWLRLSVPYEVDGRPTVVLASPDVSLFIPAWAGHRVVYGHPYETLNNDARKEQVEAWYQGEGCDDLLAGDTFDGESWQVDYVIVGPRERALSEDGQGCYTMFDEPITTQGDVAIYRVR